MNLQKIIDETRDIYDDIEHSSIVMDALDYLEEKIKLEERIKKSRTMNWIDIKDRIPDRYQYVLLIADRYWNAPDAMGHPHVAAVGYLDEIGGHQYFSIFGERGMKIDSFTHWMSIPDYPEEVEQ